MTNPIPHCSSGPTRRAAGVGCVPVATGPMETAWRQGVTRRRHPERRISAGPSTPNRSQPASSLHPKTGSSTSSAAFRPCAAVFGVPSGRKKGGKKGEKGRLKSLSSSNQRGLMAAGAALKDFTCAVTQNVMRRSFASGTTKSLWPACGLKRLLALPLGSIVLEKFRHRQPRLKLDSVHRHDRHLALVDGSHFTGRGAHHMSLADVHC